MVYSIPEDTRWSQDQKDIFVSINEKVKFLMDRKAEESSALLSIWFIVHALTPLGTSSHTMREFIAQTVKASNPWKYFNSTLICQDILVCIFKMYPRNKFLKCQKEKKIRKDKFNLL